MLNILGIVVIVIITHPSINGVIVNFLLCHIAQAIILMQKTV